MKGPSWRARVRACSVVAVAAAVVGCSNDSDDASGSRQNESSAASVGASALARSAPELEALESRLAAIERAVTEWRTASDSVDAHAAAERAANLVVGPFGPGYGDRDFDGELTGESETGLLPGLEGEPRGLAQLAVDAGAPRCVADDVLGGEWVRAGRRWQRMAVAIDRWTASNDSFAQLRSRPQRVVGLATLTLGSDEVDVARAHGERAAVELEASRAALTDCP